MARIALAASLALAVCGSGVRPAAAADKPGKAGAKPTAPAAAEKPRVRLKWSTASEVDNYGFFVMRGDAEEGPFKQRNDKAVPGGGNSDTPREYVWEDFEVEPGRTYFYYLESISVQGVREKFSPVLSKTCCSPPKPAASPSPAAPKP